MNSGLKSIFPPPRRIFAALGLLGKGLFLRAICEEHISDLDSHHLTYLPASTSCLLLVDTESLLLVLVHQVVNASQEIELDIPAVDAAKLLNEPLAELGEDGLGVLECRFVSFGEGSINIGAQLATQHHKPRRVGAAGAYYRASPPAAQPYGGLDEVIRNKIKAILHAVQYTPASATVLRLVIHDAMSNVFFYLWT